VKDRSQGKIRLRDYASESFAKGLREEGFLLEVVWDYDLCNLLTKAK